MDYTPSLGFEAKIQHLYHQTPPHQGQKGVLAILVVEVRAC